MKLRQWLSGSIGCIGILFLILDGKTALMGAREGIELCIETLIPSLFPFFLFTSLLTGAFVGQTTPLLRPLGRLFRMPKGTESLLVASFLGGYPVGAQSVEIAWEHRQLTKQDAERMLSFCSNAGPSFLFGIVAFSFPERQAAWILWGVHIITAWMVNRLLFCPQQSSCKPAIFLPKGNAMLTSVKTMGCVCGWVIMFRIILRFLDRWFFWKLSDSCRVAVTGILELSNGCCSLSQIPDLKLRFIICSGLLAFGGLCITLQTSSVIHGLSMKYYCMGKLLQSVFSVILSICIVYNIPYMVFVFIGIFVFFPIKQKIPVEIPGKL